MHGDRFRKTICPNVVPSPFIACGEDIWQAEPLEVNGGKVEEVMPPPTGKREASKQAADDTERIRAEEDGSMMIGSLLEVLQSVDIAELYSPPRVTKKRENMHCNQENLLISPRGGISVSGRTATRLRST